MSGTEITMLRRGDSLVPSCEMFREDLLSIPEGKEIFVTMRRARSPKHHRFWFAALQEIVRSGQWEGSVETLLIWIKIATGHVTVVVGDKGKTFYVPKSIDWASMPEDAFTAFKREAEKVLGERLHVDMEAIYEAVMSRSRLRDDVPTEDPVPEAPQINEDTPSMPEAANDTGRTDEPLDARLRALATALEKDTPEAFEAAWGELRGLSATKVLRVQCLDPDSNRDPVKAIKDFAQMLAKGELKGGVVGYREMVEKVIQSAMRRRAA